VHCSIGKTEFEAEKLKNNFKALVEGLNKAKPTTSKGVYLKKIAMSTTMGPGIRVEPQSVI
jgi:large subunit ribosomal protein L1